MPDIEPQPPSKCERAWRDCLDVIATNGTGTDLFTPQAIYQVMVDWAKDLDRRGEARFLELQRIAAERLGV